MPECWCGWVIEGDTNPDRYYRKPGEADSLRELGGFAATLKLVMTMQTEPGLRQPGRRVGALACVAILSMSFGPPIIAGAEAHPVHARPKTPVRTTMVAQTNARVAGHAMKAVAVSRSKAAHGVAAKHTQSKSAARTATANGRARAEVRARGRRVQEDQPEAVVTHRAALARGGRKMPALRANESREVTPRAGVRHSHATIQPHRVAAPTVAGNTPLTVDDFVHAAAPEAAVRMPVVKTYVPGESHTEEDERLATQRVAIQVPVQTSLPTGGAWQAASGTRPPILALKPVVKRPAVTDTIEASEGGMPVPLEDSAPSDLVGAPLTPASAPRPVRDVRRDALAARLPVPSRDDVTAAALQPVVLPGLYRNGRLVVPAPLKGTHEILVHQNTMADDEGLERIQDENDLMRLRAAHLLVNFPESASLRVNPELGADRRCARVWTVKFAGDIARGFYARFHQPLQVNSAVRTVAYQVRLQRTNGNAAGIDGETASPHLTGQAMDLGKRGMSVAQVAWMRAYLLPLMQAGKVDVEEEFQQACFHISVYRSYMPAPVKKRSLPRNEVAQLKETRIVKSTGTF
jgi:hypothetical protein